MLAKETPVRAAGILVKSDGPVGFLLSLVTQPVMPKRINSSHKLKIPFMLQKTDKVEPIQKNKASENSLALFLKYLLTTSNQGSALKQ